jgi:hypothetical protein
VAAGCRVARPAGPSLALLFEQARARRERLAVEGCYRSLDDQLSLYRQYQAQGGPCVARPQTYPDGRPRGTSNHGWGKAIDFAESGGSLTFGSSGFRFLQAHAEQAGWVHPSWAARGQACAEPWHWEWIGDGGTQGGPQVRADVVSAVGSSAGDGVLLVTGLGAVEPRGAASPKGSAAGVPLAWVVTDATATPSGAGYWMLGGDGGVFSYGDARFFGSTGDRPLNAPAVAMAPTPSGGGYWFVAADGGVFTFGDAPFLGSLGATHINAPIVGMAPTRSGRGYWLVAADGGVFSFGDARFLGSAGGAPLAAPVVAMAVTSTGDGYWLAAEDGGIFTYGDAPFRGAAVAEGRRSPFVDILATGGSYRLVAADGDVQSR